jgi:hypothetical protein
MTITTFLPCGDIVTGPTTSRPAECSNPQHRAWQVLDRPDQIQKREQADAVNKRLKQQMDFEQLVRSRKHWELRHDRDPAYGRRTFEYASGKQAMLWVELLPAMSLKGIAAHFSVPFSAGPEESDTGDLETVGRWLTEKERVLTVPLRVAEAKTYDDAWQMTLELSSPAIYTLACIFDLDPSTTGAVFRHRLIVASAPKLRRKAEGNV